MVDGLTLSNCLGLIVQAFAKRAGGDEAGGMECLEAAIIRTPFGTVDLILDMIRTGALPVPGPGTMDEWMGIFRAARRGAATSR